MKEISEAMAKAFSEIEDVKLNKVNPFFNSKYADLTGIIHTIKPVLVKHGLFFRQVCHQSITHAIVETFIHHASGEFFSCGQCSVPLKKADPQQFGSAFTYARRYSLGAAFGITTDDDDDGNSAIKQPEVKKPPRVMSELDKAQACWAKIKDTSRQHMEGLSRTERTELMKKLDFDKDKINALCDKEIAELESELADKGVE